MAPYNIFKAAGFKNLRQVLGKAGKSQIAKSASKATSKSIDAAGDVAVSHIKAQSAGSAYPSAFKKGGFVRRGGMAKVHKGELIIPSNMVKKLHIRPRR